MSVSRAEYLIDRLISNKLSREELAELLSGVNNEAQQQRISDALEIYFYKLLQENDEKNGQ